MFSHQALRPDLIADLVTRATSNGSSVTNEAQLRGAARTLPQHGLVAVGWAGVAAAAVFVALRCVARITESRRLFTDDYWIIAALIFLLVNAILQTFQAASLYYLVYVSVGRVPAGAALIAQGDTYVAYEFVIIGLFWTVLWCVKASFLALFYRLFDGLPTYRKLWWAVVVFSSLAYVGCWIASVWTCHPPSTYFHFGQCSKPIDVKGSNISISYSTAVDILSDIFIMLLPLRLLPRLQVPRRQKIGLAGVFCVGVLVIAAAIARLTQIIGQERSDPVGLAVWGLVESSISVIVGSMPPLKSFLGRTISRTRRGYSPYDKNTGSKNNTLGKSPKNMTKDEPIPLETSVSTSRSKQPTNPSTGQIVVQQEYGWARSSESEVDAEGPFDDETRIINGLQANPHHDPNVIDGRSWLK